MGRLLFKNDVTTERLEKRYLTKQSRFAVFGSVWNRLIQNSQMDYDAAIQEFIDILGKEPKALTLFARATSILTFGNARDIVYRVQEALGLSKDVAFTLLSRFPFLYVLTRQNRFSREYAAKIMGWNPYARDRKFESKKEIKQISLPPLLPEELHSNQSVVYHVVSVHGALWKYAPARLQSDEDLLNVAAATDARSARACASSRRSLRIMNISAFQTASIRLFHRGLT